MLENASSLIATRRGVLGGLGLLMMTRPARATSLLENEASPDAVLRLNYKSRLDGRLTDAGGGAFDVDFAHALLVETNRFREQNGLEPYAWDEGLAASAQAHAADMAHRNYFDHASPEGFTHLDRVSLMTRTLCGRTAENLLWRGNDPRRQTPAAFETLWEDSECHRNNLLRPSYTGAGYGVVRIKSRYYAAGIYSDAAVRLNASLPVQISDSKSLTEYLENCHPTIRSFAVTKPFKDATSVFPLSDQGRYLAPGAWQVRPLVPTADRLTVLSGPTFFISG